MYRNKEQEGGACIHVGGVSFSQFGLVHAIHEFLQLDRQRHVSFDLQLPWHECHRGLQFSWNNKTAASLMFPIVIFFFFFFFIAMVTGYLKTSCWSHWSPFSWQRQLWWGAHPAPRCPSQSSSPETKRQCALLYEHKQVLKTRPLNLFIWT